eukprot:gene7883-9360_t
MGFSPDPPPMVQDAPSDEDEDVQMDASVEKSLFSSYLEGAESDQRLEQGLSRVRQHLYSSICLVCLEKVQTGVATYLPEVALTHFAVPPEFAISSKGTSGLIAVPGDLAGCMLLWESAFRAPLWKYSNLVWQDLHAPPGSNVRLPNDLRLTQVLGALPRWTVPDSLQGDRDEGVPVRGHQEDAAVLSEPALRTQMPEAASRIPATCRLVIKDGTVDTDYCLESERERATILPPPVVDADTPAITLPLFSITPAVSALQAAAGSSDAETGALPSICPPCPYLVQ